ncbi:MAG TPA: zf-HC2 domain-containing protein [Kofleriaceae bacterium]|nr:zf-HC2 domain-containing protein [Kofleriaceae bacterium]
MTLCQSIETLSMAFLDDELVAEERRELELHLLDCAGCRQHVDAERADLSLIRKALVPPPASAMLKARISRALDAEDAAAIRNGRRRWSSWLLPGSAIAAAAAALLVVFGAPRATKSRESSDVATVVKRQSQGLPLEVQGASTGAWLRENFAPVEPPQFAGPGILLLGGRLLPNGIANHDAALLQYLVTFGSERLSLTAVVLKDLRSDAFSDGQAYQVGDLVLRVHNAGGMPAVTYINPSNHVGYVFASERMTAGELLQLVVSTDLIDRAQQRR